MTTKIDELLESTMQKIAEAAGKRDLATVAGLTRKAAELEEMKKTVHDIEKKLKSLEDSAIPVPSQRQVDVTARELPIEVTQGMLNQNLLTLTAHVKRGRIRAGEELTIEAYPSGERFRTELMTSGNKVQERGAIGRFYHEAGVQAGDFVVLTEVERGRWILKKAPHGQFQSRRSVLAML